MDGTGDMNTPNSVNSVENTGGVGYAGNYGWDPLRPVRGAATAIAVVAIVAALALFVDFFYYVWINLSFMDFSHFSMRDIRFLGGLFVKFFTAAACSGFFVVVALYAKRVTDFLAGVPHAAPAPGAAAQQPPYPGQI